MLLCTPPPLLLDRLNCCPKHLRVQAQVISPLSQANETAPSFAAFQPMWPAQSFRMQLSTH
jgi:hypothetical protein